MIRVSFSLFLSFSVFCYFRLLLIFTKIILLLLLYFFHENYFYFFMFWDVPECSGMFRVPGFIDAPILAAFSLTATAKIGPDTNSLTFMLVTARFWP